LGCGFSIPEMTCLITEAAHLPWARKVTTIEGHRRSYFQVDCIDLAKTDCTDLIVDFFSPTELCSKAG
jgi:hypothetical protein